MRKFICLLLMTLMTSGCCEVFGICTSVHVNTLAPSSDKFASSNSYNHALQAFPESDVRTANANDGKPMLSAQRLEPAGVYMLFWTS
jgi:hypothetical protein